MDACYHAGKCATPGPPTSVTTFIQPCLRSMPSAQRSCPAQRSGSISCGAIRLCGGSPGELTQMSDTLHQLVDCRSSNKLKCVGQGTDQNEKTPVDCDCDAGVCLPAVPGTTHSRR